MVQDFQRLCSFSPVWTSDGPSWGSIEEKRRQAARSRMESEEQRRREAARFDCRVSSKTGIHDWREVSFRDEIDRYECRVCGHVDWSCRGLKVDSTKAKMLRSMRIDCDEPLRNASISYDGCDKDDCRIWVFRREEGVRYCVDPVPLCPCRMRGSTCRCPLEDIAHGLMAANLDDGLHRKYGEILICRGWKYADVRIVVGTAFVASGKIVEVKIYKPEDEDGRKK